MNHRYRPTRSRGRTRRGGRGRGRSGITVDVGEEMVKIGKMNRWDMNREVRRGREWEASPKKGRERPQKSRRTPLPVLDPIWTHHLFQSALSPNEAGFFFFPFPSSLLALALVSFFFLFLIIFPSLPLSPLHSFFFFLNSPRASFEWGGEKVARVEESRSECYHRTARCSLKWQRGEDTPA